MTGPIRAVLFDLWETLIHDPPERSLPRQVWRTEAVCRALSAAGLQCETQDVRSALDSSMRALNQLHDTGVDVDSPGRAALFGYWLKTVTSQELPLGAAEAVEEAITGLTEEFAPGLMDGAVETLASVKTLGLRTVLVSNAGFTTAPSLRWLLERHGLRDHLDALVFSDEHQLAKPAARLFTLALEAIGEEASACAFVGDSPHNDVAGAQAAGMFAVQIGAKQREGITPDLRIDMLSELIPGLQAQGLLANTATV